MIFANIIIRSYAPTTNHKGLINDINKTYML